MKTRLKKALKVLLVTLFVLGIFYLFAFDAQVTEYLHEIGAFPRLDNLGTRLAVGILLVVLIARGRARLMRIAGRTKRLILSLLTKLKKGFAQLGIGFVWVMKSIWAVLFPTSRRGKAIRNLVVLLVAVPAILFCVWRLFGDAVAGLFNNTNSLPRSANLGTRVSPEQATLDEMWRWSWIIGTILIGAGFGILRKKGQHSNIGCLLASAGLHTVLINMSIWLSKMIVLFLFPGGLYYFFSVLLTVSIIFFWVFRSFFKECVLNKKIVPIDTIGVGSFLGRRLSILNKAVGGSINQLLPSFLGMSWEYVDSKKLTYPLEKEAGKTDAVVQCGANGSEFPAHITGTVVVVCIDPKKSKTNPLSPDQMRLYALGALTVVLSDASWTTVSQIRGNLKGVSDQALNAGTIRQRFSDSGYELSSITITKVENPPSIEEAMLALRKQALDDQRELANIHNMRPKIDALKLIFPTMNDEQLARFIQLEEKIRKGVDVRSGNGGSGRKNKRNSGGGGNPPIVVTTV